MKHFSCTLASPRRHIEVTAEDYIQAQKIAAVLIGTRRERDIYVREIPAPKATVADLVADTEDNREHSV